MNSIFFFEEQIGKKKYQSLFLIPETQIIIPTITFL